VCDHSWVCAAARSAWESADTGREECPLWTPYGTDRFWTRDQEIQVSADVAYAIAEYVVVIGDERFRLDAGAEILFETSRFWGRGSRSATTARWG
jgi:kojibiose phosphorylase